MTEILDNPKMLIALQKKFPELSLTEFTPVNTFILSYISLIERAFYSNNLEEFKDHLINGVDLANQLFLSKKGNMVINILRENKVVTAYYLIKNIRYGSMTKSTAIGYLNIADQLGLLNTEKFNTTFFRKLFPNLPGTPRFLGRTNLYVRPYATPEDYYNIYKFYAEKTEEYNVDSHDDKVAQQTAKVLFRQQIAYCCPYCFKKVYAETNLLYSCKRHSFVIPVKVRLSKEELKLKVKRNDDYIYNKGNIIK